MTWVTRNRPVRSYDWPSTGLAPLSGAPVTGEPDAGRGIVLGADNPPVAAPHGVDGDGESFTAILQRKQKEHGIY